MIQTQSLSVYYGDKQAVRDVTFHAPAGKITAIVGPSGCGKSTFLSSLNRMTDLIPSARIEGQVIVNCCDVQDRNRSPAELRRCVGMIFQKPNPFAMSIRNNIQLAVREHGQRDRQQLNQITESVLRDVGLWDEVKDRLDDSALKLSGGQQQRLCIARALALKPSILLMDEPCSALDPIASATVEALILSLKERYTILIVTHNLAQARRISDEVAMFWMNDGAGEIIEQGPTETVFSKPNHPIAAAYFAGTSG
ncbi:phosphate ABC transporter ATP-binding protein [Planctomycetes bacterium K23_9]|uniref:Phosphate import ATP-binding protein PstB 3 n=1 Tax=Stieleria marina TaxID=1930275 RepID=A0A517NVI1_9BACT|nr:Phosphate import ATP-binding protein PstB 3 [Planctomycetes bacterium K23_9]